MKRTWMIAVAAGLAALALVVGPFDLSIDLHPNLASARSEAFWTDAGETAGPRVANPTSFADMAEALSPAVVSVKVDKKVEQTAFEGQELFEEFFGRPPQGRRQPRSRRGPSVQHAGSGFVISGDGYIVTNNHVVENAEKVVAIFSDGTELEAQVVGRDPKTDLALIKVEGEGFEVTPLGDSADVRVGEWVMAIGNPFGLEHTVTVGILSAKGRRGFGDERIAGPYDDFLQTDASINPGNSGGPLIDMQGRVIGINTAIANPRIGAQGIGFAIPINMAKDLLPQLKETGKVTRGWLGVQIQRVTPNLAKTFELDTPRGALVGQVFENTPAAKAGLKTGDVIVEFAGREVSDFDDLPRIVASTPPGTKVHVKVMRNGKIRKLDATLERMEDEEATVPAVHESTSSEWGFETRRLDDESATELGLEDVEGMLVVEVEAGSPAAEAGLRRGDVILEVNRKKVDRAKELQAALEGQTDHATLLLQRGQSTMYVVLERSVSD